MDFISMILFTILFVAQIVLYILYFLKKRHDDLRYSALLQYIDRKVSDADCRDEIEEMEIQSAETSAAEVVEVVEVVAVEEEVEEVVNGYNDGDLSLLGVTYGYFK